MFYRFIKTASVLLIAFLLFVVLLFFIIYAIDNNSRGIEFYKLLILLAISLFILSIIILLNKFYADKYTDVYIEGDEFVFIKNNRYILRKKSCDLINFLQKDSFFVFQFNNSEDVAVIVNLYSMQQIRNIKTQVTALCVDKNRTQRTVLCVGAKQQRNDE